MPRRRQVPQEYDEAPPAYDDESDLSDDGTSPACQVLPSKAPQPRTLQHETVALCSVLRDQPGVCRFLKPSDIFFTHDCISENFRDGRSIRMTLDELLAGDTSKRNVEMMRVVFYEGRFHSMSNRRLCVYRLLAMMGVCSVVKVEIVDRADVSDTWWNRIFSTACGGYYVQIRRTEEVVGMHAEESTFDLPRPAVPTPPLRPMPSAAEPLYLRAFAADGLRRGIVEQFDTERGRGLIRTLHPYEESEVLLVRASDIYATGIRSLVVGEYVYYHRRLNDKGRPVAKSVSGPVQELNEEYLFRPPVSIECHDFEGRQCDEDWPWDPGEDWGCSGWGHSDSCQWLWQDEPYPEKVLVISRDEHHPRLQEFLELRPVYESTVCSYVAVHGLRAEGKLVMLQIARADGCIALLNLCTLTGIPEIVREMLEGSAIGKAVHGMGPEDVGASLWEEWGVSMDRTVSISQFAKDQSYRRLGLASLAEDILQYKRPNRKKLKEWDWRSGQLTESQLRHASLDPWILMRLFKRLQSPCCSCWKLERTTRRAAPRSCSGPHVTVGVPKELRERC